jgi:hypothetical protein
VAFDESNGSQVEQVDEVCVGKEKTSTNDIKKMAISEIKPQEEDEVIETSPNLTAAAKPREKSGESGNFGDSELNPREFRPSEEDAQDCQENEDLIQQEASEPHLIVHKSVQRDHPINNILGSIRRRVNTRSRLANFCGHYSFVSMIEPLSME